MNRPVKQGRVRSDWADFALPKHEKPRRGRALTRAQEGPSEEYLQDFAEQYCANNGLECHHIPDIILEICFGPRKPTGPDEEEDLRDAGEQIKGWPDCFIMDPKFPWQFLPLELKKRTGTLTRRQRERQQAIRSRVPRSTQEIEETIQAWRETLHKRGVCKPFDLALLHMGVKE